MGNESIRIVTVPVDGESGDPHWEESLPLSHVSIGCYSFQNLPFVQSSVVPEASRTSLLFHLADGRIRPQCLWARVTQKSNPGVMKFPSIILLLKSLTGSVM